MRLQTRLARSATSLTEIVVVMAIIMVLAGLSYYAFSAAKGFADKMEGDTRIAIGHVGRHGKKDVKAMQAIAAAPIGAATGRPDRVPGDYYVGFNPTVTNPNAEAQRLANLVSGKVVGVYTHGVFGCGLRCPDANIGNITGDPAVRMVDQAHAVYMCQAQTLNVQRCFSNGIIGTTATTPVNKMFGAPPSIFRMYRNNNIQGVVTSRINLTGASTASVTVVVMDTGIDNTHPDLNVVYQQDFTGNTDPMDRCGHGTHVAGIIGAVDKTSSGGTVGIYPGAPLINLKISSAGPPPGWGMSVPAKATTSLSVYGALDWVVANAASVGVCNMSFFAPLQDPTMDALANAAADLGVIMCASAGEVSPPPAVNLQTSPTSPGCARGAICVAHFSDLDGMPGSFKTVAAGDDAWGKSSNFGPQVAFVANGGSLSLPGGYGIYSTIPLAGQAANALATPYSPFVFGTNIANNQAEGTSFAVPNVSGMMALLKDPQTNYGFVLGAGRGVTTYHLQMNTRDQAVAALFNATHQTTPFQMINPLTGSAWQIVGAHRIVMPYTKSLYGDYVLDPLKRSVPVPTFYSNPNVAPAFLAPFPG